jgi:hypothetical protein
MNTPLLASHERHAVPSLSGVGDDPDANSQLTQMLRAASSPPSNATLIRNTNGRARGTRRQLRPLAAVSFLTVLIGSLTIIQAGLLWASFLSTSWLQVHVVVTNIIFAPPLDTIVRNLDLGSMVSMLVSIGQTMAVGFLAITTIIIPCCAMIAQPMTVLERHAAVVSGGTFDAKSTMLNFVRFGFLIVYIVLILDLSTSSIELNLVDSKIAVQNRIGSGLVFYMIGMTMAVVSAKLLTVATVSEVPTVGSMNVMEEGYMRVLEEELEERGEETTNAQEFDALDARHNDAWCGCSYRLIMFESAVLSIILAIAAFALPLFQVSYQGVASDFLSQTTLEVHITDLVQPPQGPAHAILQGTVMSQLFIFPSMALFLAAGVCFLGFKKKWLSGVRPAVNGITICAAILVVIPALQSLGKEMLDEQVSGFCSEFENLTGESCLTIVGTVGAGTWCLVGHAIALEIFIALTLWRA